MLNRDYIYSTAAFKAMWVERILTLLGFPDITETDEI